MWAIFDTRGIGSVEGKAYIHKQYSSCPVCLRELLGISLQRSDCVAISPS